MAVVIRLRREGKKKRPFYRIVATDSRYACDSNFLEILGQYNPIPKEEMININEDRMIYWMRNGAKPSTSVKSLLSKNGLWKKLAEEAKPIKPKTDIDNASDEEASADTTMISSQTEGSAKEEVE